MDLVTLTLAKKATKKYVDEVAEGIARGLIYKGAVDYYKDLPKNADLGHYYTVRYKGESGIEISGAEYVWGKVIADGVADWIYLGEKIDLSAYYNKDEVDNLLDNKIDSDDLDNYYTKEENNTLLNGKVNNSTYNNKIDEIENELGKKLEETDLADYIKNTDYATTTKAGLMTAADKTKLNGIAQAAQVNVIESIEINGVAATIDNNKKASVTIEAGAIDTISVNGTAQTIDENKNVNIIVPTKTSDITNDSNFINNSVNNLTNYYTKTEIDSTIGNIGTLVDTINGEVI